MQNDMYSNIRNDTYFFAIMKCVLDQIVILVFKQPLSGLIFNPVKHAVRKIVAFLVLVELHFPVKVPDPVLHYQGMGIFKAGN